MEKTIKYPVGVHTFSKCLSKAPAPVWEKPVFRFDLSGANFNNPEVLVNHIGMYIDNI